MTYEQSGLNPLPKSWLWTTIGQLYDVVGGGTPSTSIAEYWKGGIPWITSADIYGLKDIRPRKHTTKDGIENSATNLVPERSLIVVTRVGLGKIALTKTPICFSQDSQALVGNSSLLYPEYSLYYLSEAVQIFKYRHRGTTISGVTKKQLSELPFPLPPFHEQYRIASKVEELFSRLDAGVESLWKVRAQLKRYRQAVLKYAFEGKLTEEWRKTHKDQIEPAQKLLTNVKERLKTSLMFSESLPNLPTEWMWTKLGDLTDLTSGKAFKADEYSEKGIRLFQIANVSFGKIKWENKIYLPESYLEKYPNLILKNDDILLALNRPILNGMLKVGQLHEQDAPAILYQRVGRFDFYFPFLKLYLFNYFQSPQFLDCLKHSLQGVDQPFVNKPRLLEIPVPIAPLKEQEIILEQIQYELSLCEKVEQIAEQSLGQSEQLHQSILKTAFEGKLLPQDPSDEPADKLLERIKEERVKHESKSEKEKKNDLRQMELVRFVE